MLRRGGRSYVVAASAFEKRRDRNVFLRDVADDRVSLSGASGD